MSIVLALLGNRLFSGGAVALLIAALVYIGFNWAEVEVLRTRVSDRDAQIATVSATLKERIADLDVCHGNVETARKAVSDQNDALKSANEEWLAALAESRKLRDQLAKKPSTVTVVRTVIAKQQQPPSTCEDAMPAVDALIRSLR